MAEEKDTDRLASELLGKIRDALNKPLPGTGKKTPKPQVDDGDNSLLDTIKDFLTQALPGTKPIAQPTTPPAPTVYVPPLTPTEVEAAAEPVVVPAVEKETDTVRRRVKKSEEIDRRRKVESHTTKPSPTRVRKESAPARDEVRGTGKPGRERAKPGKGGGRGRGRKG